MADVSAGIEVHQCLFGYEDGHRLLAASLDLPHEALGNLLPFSDLAPGLSLARHESYWSGIPLPATKLYALMRTWSAWEKRRPGCVWSHALLLGFADLAQLVDLAVLQQFFARPESEDLSAFASPIVVAAARPSGVRPAELLNALAILREVYSNRHGILSCASSPDNAVFAVWSQQWPRLRRGFSFRTAGSALESSGPAGPVDLVVIRSRDEIHESAPTPIESVALADLQHASMTPCRRFLWRYGSDVRDGRESFWSLVELFSLTQHGNTPNTINVILDQIERAFPGTEARLLKSDLMACETAEYAQFPPLDFVALYSALLLRGTVAWPLPSHEQARVLIRARRLAIAPLAEIALQHESELASLLLEVIASEATWSDIVSIPEEFPSAKRFLLRTRSDLISESALKASTNEQLLSVLELLGDEAGVVDEFARAMLAIDSPFLARACFVRFPQAAAHACATSLGSDGRAFLRDSWRDALRENSGAFLTHDGLSNCRTTSSLAAVAAILGHDRNEVLEAGPQFWAKAVRVAKDDVDGAERSTFLTFLLVLALFRPVEGAEALFELAFEHVHDAIWRSALPASAFDSLLRYLPAIDWWRMWDTCLRLRKAVTAAYVKGNLQLDSFYRLTSNRRLMDQMVELADDTSRGRRFLKR